MTTGIHIPLPATRGYADHSIFVTTDWLESHLDDPGLRILDTDGVAEHSRAHIPNSVPVIDHYYKASPKNRTYIQGPEEFSATMSALGVSDDTQVVAYDSNGCQLAFRLAWCLNYYGHTKVKVLDGGFPKWLAEGRPVTRAKTAVTKGNFKARPQPAVLATKQDVTDSLGRQDTVLLDVRGDDEWDGSNKRDNVRGGRIPGAVHIEWKHFLTKGDVPTVLPAADLRRVLNAAGVTPDKRVITY